MKKYLFIICGFALLLTACTNSSKKYDVTLESLLDEMVNRQTLTAFPEIPYKAAQVSSYDRRTIAPDQPGWWANADGGGYERLDTVGTRYEKVLCDLKGAGAVTRIWMTTKEKFGTIRIYLDGSVKPQIEIPAYDMKRFPVDVPAGLSLTHTHYDDAMEGVGGNSFFLPIPYQRGCKITFEEPDLSIFIPRYYHIGYRTYPEGTKVKTFTIKDAIALSARIEEVSSELLDPKGVETEESVTSNMTLQPGESLTMELPQGSKTVGQLSIKTLNPEALLIEAVFDGVRTVSAPLAHFCGAGAGAPQVDGWWIEHIDGVIVSRFPMPYKEDACIVLKNISDCAVEVEMTAGVSDFQWSERSLYFHASHRSEAGIPVSPEYDSDDNLDWNFMTINGRGLYLGDLLSLENHAIDWYGEGDEKIFVDDDTFPSFMGTGTEDYFNCSWAPVVPFLTPFGGAPRADEDSSHGWNAFLRTRNLDLIPFTNRMKFDIEMSSWHFGTVDYNATSFWYGDLTDTVNATM